MWDSASNCFDSTSQAVTITNGLTCNTIVSFTYTLGSNGQVGFTNTSTNLPAGAQYYWSFGGGNSSSQGSPTNTYYYNGTYTVYLQITDSTGYCTQSTSQTLTVTTGHTCSLNAAFTYTLGSSGQVLFTNTSAGIDSITHYVWNYNDGAQSFNFDAPPYFSI
jgi:PKD repeat protein